MIVVRDLIREKKTFYINIYFCCVLVIIKTETALNRPEFNVDKEDAIIFKELSKVKEEPGMY